MFSQLFIYSCVVCLLSDLYFICEQFKETMKLLQDLAPSLNPGGQQIVGSCGSCAWSSDGRYFAWSCGHRIVKVIRHNG